jgi:hypothetical protein
MEGDVMSGFETPADLKHNRGLIADPVSFAQDALDSLPRPTLVTCWTGPRSSALTPRSPRRTLGQGSDEGLHGATYAIGIRRGCFSAVCS